MEILEKPPTLNLRQVSTRIYESILLAPLVGKKWDNNEINNITNWLKDKYNLNSRMHGKRLLVNTNGKDVVLDTIYTLKQQAAIAKKQAAIAAIVKKQHTQEARLKELGKFGIFAGKYARALGAKVSLAELLALKHKYYGYHTPHLRDIMNDLKLKETQTDILVAKINQHINQSITGE